MPEPDRIPPPRPRDNRFDPFVEAPMEFKPGLKAQPRRCGPWVDGVCEKCGESANVANVNPLNPFGV